jgi:heme iron utilization protein
MTRSSARKHAGPGPATDLAPVPEPTFAERARTLAYMGRMGSLSTLSRKQPGFPFGSVMPYGLDDHGRPIFLISTMARPSFPLASRWSSPLTAPAEASVALAFCALTQKLKTHYRTALERPGMFPECYNFSGLPSDVPIAGA